MTKNFIYLAAALAFVSCAKNEVTDVVPAPANSDVIGFTSSTNGTRVAKNDQTVEDMKDGFTVVGLDKDAASLFAQPDGNAISSLYSYGSKWDWALQTEDKKWPATERYPLTFIAAYPDNAAAEFGPWATGSANYTMGISVDESAGLAGNFDKLAAYSPVTSKPASGVAPMNFKHILSKIQFQIVSPVGYKIYVQSLTIKNVAKEGRTYNYNSVLASAYSAEPAYTAAQLANFIHMNGAGTGAVELLGKGFDNLATDGAPVPSGDGTGTETWKMMPQKTVAAWDKVAFTAAAKKFYEDGGTDWAAFVAATPALFAGSYIEMTYRMEDAVGKSIVGRKLGEEVNGTPLTSDMFVTVAFPLDIATVNTDKGWEPAKQYTYQIKLGTPDASNGTVTDPVYKDETGGNTDTPDIENPKPVKPGEDITDKDGYIGFEVIVDEWLTNGNTTVIQ